jgi:hypothetical protein
LPLPEPSGDVLMASERLVQLHAGV